MMNRLAIPLSVIGLTLLGLSAVRSAPAQAQPRPNSNLLDRPNPSKSAFFPDTVVAKGKGFEIKQSQVDEMFLAFKGHRAAMGQLIPDHLRPQIEADILEKLIATQLFLRRATEQDKTKAKEVAQTFLAEQKKQVPSEDSFRRQLLAVGMTPDEFSSQIAEQAIVKAVIDREIKTTRLVTDAEAVKFYTDNPSLFQEPELVRASHILIATREPITGQPLTPEPKLERKRLAQQLLARARTGEDFGKLVKEFSEDAGSKDRGGEYTFPRAKDDPRRAMAPEFEAAAFSMKPNQISDIVETGYGYHIIKTLEKVPARKIDYRTVENQIKENLLREAVEKALPEHIEKLKKEAGVEILIAQQPRP